MPTCLAYPRTSILLYEASNPLQVVQTKCHQSNLFFSPSEIESHLQYSPVQRLYSRYYLSGTTIPTTMIYSEAW
jgi:hypothetical protein